MRIFLFSTFLLLLISSCSKEKITFQEGKVNSLDQILKFDNLNGLLTNSSVVFKNANGKTKKFNISFTKSQEELSFDHVKYFTPKYAFQIYDPTDLNYAIYVYVTSNIVNITGEERAYLSSSIFINNFDRYTASLGFDQNGEPSICTYSAKKSFNDKNFESVFSSPTVENINGFSELHYSSKIGVVCFRDDKNDLWVFDRYEK